MQRNKSIKIFIKFFLGPLLFAWLAFSIYQQIRHQPQLAQSWESIKSSLNSYKILYLLSGVVLVFVNWGLESLKWKLLIRNVHPLTFYQSFKAVLSGVSFSVTMPNRIGEYVGRMLYMPDGSRLKTISLAIVGSIAQLLITLFVGVFGLIILKRELLSAYPVFTVWYQFILYGIIVLFGLLLLFYFHVHRVINLFQRWFRSKRYLYLVEALAAFNTIFLLQLLFISFIRYLVFLLQYILIFYLFNVAVPVITVIWVMSIIFLALAIIPSIALIEVGLRGEISLKLMGIFTINSLGIGLASVTVWFINLIIPAIIGTLLMINIKLLDKKRSLHLNKQPLNDV